MNKNRKEIIVLVIESILVILFSAVFYQKDIKSFDFAIVAIALVSVVYSITGFLFRFTFFGHFLNNQEKNDILRFFTMIIAMVIAAIVVLL